MGAEALRNPARLLALRRLAELMDSAFVVPGTTYRIGFDPIIGLVPWIGDLVSPAFTVALLWHARDVGLPKVVLLRMIFNATIDSLIGTVPFFGDLFDFGFKANQKNFALLEKYAFEEHGVSAGDWLFVLAMMAVVVLLAAVPLLLAGWLISWAAGHLF